MLHIPVGGGTSPFSNSKMGPDHRPDPGPAERGPASEPETGFGEPGRALPHDRQAGPPSSVDPESAGQDMIRCPCAEVGVCMAPAGNAAPVQERPDGISYAGTTRVFPFTDRRRAYCDQPRVRLDQLAQEAVQLSLSAAGGGAAPGLVYPNEVVGCLGPRPDVLLNYLHEFGSWLIACGQARPVLQFRRGIEKGGALSIMQRNAEEARRRAAEADRWWFRWVGGAGYVRGVGVLYRRAGRAFAAAGLHADAAPLFVRAAELEGGRPEGVRRAAASLVLAALALENQGKSDAAREMRQSAVEFAREHYFRGSVISAGVLHFLRLAPFELCRDLVAAVSAEEREALDEVCRLGTPGFGGGGPRRPGAAFALGWRASLSASETALAQAEAARLCAAAD